jgi:hypothetical protein
VRPDASPLPWDTALVTGASSGIGEAFVRELARGGVRQVVAVARRRERLETLAAEVGGVSGCDVQPLAADLTDPDDRATVETRLASGWPPVELLVNNAGVGTAGPFDRLDPDGEQRQIELNVTAVVRLTRAALPGMIERRGGAVLNVASLAANQPTPGMATYGGAKAFVALFGEALYEELRGTGVTVTTSLPGYTRTEFQDHLHATGYDEAPGFAWMSAAAVASASLSDAAAGRALSIPGAGYKVVAALEAPVPRSARRWLMGRLSSFTR